MASGINMKADALGMPDLRTPLPPTDDYLLRLFMHAAHSDWGRKEPRGAVLCKTLNLPVDIVRSLCLRFGLNPEELV